MRACHGLVPLLLLILPLAFTACSSDPAPEPAASDASAHPRFRLGNEALPGFLDVPFPSDAYMKDGHFVSSFPGLDRTFASNSDVLATQLGLTSGWSRIAPVLFAVEDGALPAGDNGEPPGAGIDRTSLPEDEDACKADGSSVFLVDLEATDPAAARVPCRASVLDERERDSGRTLVAIGPARGFVLAEGHRYAAVMTSRVKSESGVGLAATADFMTTAVKKEGALGAIYGAAYDTVMTSIGGALATDGARIVALAPYTTQKVTHELFAIRDALEAAPAPALSWDAAKIMPMTNAKFAAKVAGAVPAGFTASLDDWLGVVAKAAKLPDGTDDPDDSLPVRAHDELAAVGTAVFDAPSYLRVRDRKYEDLEHATFARDASGTPIPAPEAPTAKIWVTFAVPTAPMPPAGYPVVIVQHGLQGSRDYLLSLANRIASKGWMAVAIDSVTFGARSVDPKYRVDGTSEYANAPGATYKGGDGINDVVNGARGSSLELFGNLKNLLALRDQLRQAEIDTVSLVKVLRSNPDLAPLTTGAAAPKIDPDRIAYVGDSLGAIEGAVAAAIEPRVKAWTLNVGGGGVISEAAAHGPVINANLALAGTVNFGFGGTSYIESHPVVVVAQTLIEAGDPIAYADRLVMKPAPLASAPTTARNILQISVVFDELVANESNEALARAAGYALASPNVGLNSGVADLVTHAPYRGGGIKLPILPEAADGYHDVPVAGSTAILVQASPAQHGEDLVRAKCNRTYRIPFNTPDGKLDNTRQDPSPITCPYRQLQDTMVRFFGDAFEGRVPVVAGFATPTR
ncbi:MAG: Lipase-like protein [Labilithrix sp.]|nr:Lipase-like protein [Labilithrix sp.]